MEDNSFRTMCRGTMVVGENIRRCSSLAKGTIRKRSKKKNSWEIQVYLGKDRSTGKRYFHTETVAGTKADAQRRLCKILIDFKGDVYSPRSRMTVFEFLERWLEEYGRLRLRPRTLVGYRAYLQRYMPVWLGEKKMVDVRAPDITRMEAEMRDGGGVDGGALSGRTVLQMHRILSSAFEYAVKNELVKRNVVKIVQPPKFDGFEIKSLDWNGVTRLLGCVDDPRFRALVVLALQTGLRRSELLGLRWHDFDLGSMQMSVRRSWVRIKGAGLCVQPTKSRKSRVVGLMIESVDAVGELRTADAVADGFVFSDDGERAWDPDGVTKRFKYYARSAGFPRLRFHDLRHTHASLMLSRGVHEKVVSERLGHSSIIITLDLYSHVLPTMQREAMERFREGWREELPGFVGAEGVSCG